MRQTLIIAGMTFTEARRMRIVWSTVLFCLFIVSSSFIFQEVTIVALDRIMRDVGLAAINAIGVILSILLGVNVVSKDIDRKTAYVVLAKPISRKHYFVGRVLGVWLALIVSLGLMLIAFVVEMLVFGGPLRPIIFEAFFLILIELLVLTTFAVACGAVFTATALSSLISIGLFVIGHLAQQVFLLSLKAHDVSVRVGLRSLYYLLPDLERLNLKSSAASLTPVPILDVLSRAGYGLVYVGALAALGVAAFERRDLG